MASLTGVLTSVSGKFTGVFISFKTYISREQRVPTTRNGNLIFIVFSLLSLLQINSQGNVKDSPFLTHPKTCNVAIAMLLLYGLAYDAEQRFSSTCPSYANAARRGMGLFGSLLMASLASILFPGWMGPVLYVVYISFYADELIEWILRKYMNELEETGNSAV